jgi:group I intron endonuclease
MNCIGIYGIRNMVNGKWYIGQSVNIEKRKQVHFTQLKYGAHHNQHLQMAYQKYGEDSFEFRILENISVDMLDVREQAWIAYYKADDSQYGYNLDSGGSLRKRHSAETRLKMSASQKGRVFSQETKRRMSEAGKTKVFFAEQCRKLSVSHQGKRHSEDAKRKIGKASKDRGVSSETRRMQKIAVTGRPLSVETRKKMSLSRMGKHPSEETRLRLIAAQKRWRNVDPEGTRRKLVEAQQKRREAEKLGKRQ